LVAAANERFHDKGFEATTIDELCEAVEISRRTFFRYFPTKEELVFPHRAERLQRFLAFLEAAPDDESPFDTLRRATKVFAVEYMENRAHSIAQQQLIRSSPSLQALEGAIDREWEAAMARVFVQRSGPGADTELRAWVLAGATLGVIRATLRHWFDSNGEVDLIQLGFDALDCLERGFPLPQ
jgi:AcrR family transcriptional regulator